MVRKRICLLIALIASLLAPAIQIVRAAELEMADGVVVKFGPNGELVVLDGLVVQGQVALTSLNDDSQGGACYAVPSTPHPGDWRGIRVEASSPALLTNLNGLSVLFAGNGVPACTLRGTDYPVSGLSISKSAGVGLSATAGSTTAFRELILTENQTGFLTDDNSQVTLTSSIIGGNATGAVNLDLAHPVAASGNWWGHPTGPLDTNDDTASGGLYNPGGLGNAVSDGILYESFSTDVPLLGIAADLVGGAVTATSDVTFRLRGATAVGVRLSEDASFAGVPFQPVTPTRDFTLSPGDGPKTVYVQFQAATGNTAQLARQVLYDAHGPDLAVTTPASGAILTRPVTVIALASDISGVDRVEFYVDNVLVFTDRTNTYSYDWDTRIAGDGQHLLSVAAFDTHGTQTRRDLNVTVSSVPPAAPVITSPTTGLVTAASTIDVSGTADSGVGIALLRNGSLAGRVNSSPTGDWTLASVALAEGSNVFSAVASDRVGSSASSATVSVTRDTGPPSPPATLTHRDLAGGTKRFDWIASAAADVASYSLYRATAPFSATSQAVRVKSGITTVFTNDLPPAEGTFYCAVTAVDAAANESEISNVVEVHVDLTAPTGVVTATPSGVVGQVSVALTLTVSEPISGDPFLSVTPYGGTPTPVSLIAAAQPLTWQGVFTVTPGMPSGPAALVFSAHDLAGNRGTVLTSASILILDTQGPIGTVGLTPVPPLGPETFTVQLTLDEPSVADPVLRFIAPAGGSSTLTLTGSGISWQGSLVITCPTMGDGPGNFELDATDLLGNRTLGPIVGSESVVDCTAPGAPTGLAGQTIAAGQVHLTWNAIAAATYSVYRVPAGSPFNPGDPPVASGLTSPAFTDLPPADGQYSYAVAAVDAAGNASALSTPVTVRSDRTPPDSPSNLVLSIEGRAIRASWTPAATNPADSFTLYRAASPITTLNGLTPVLSGVASPTTLDHPPADGLYYYAVVGVDLAGNTSDFAAAGPLTFDQGAPVITIGGVADGQFTNQNLVITYSATDVSLQSLTATLDASGFVSGGTVSAEGDHVLVVTASDTLGNTASKTVSFAIDKQSPQIALGGVVDGTHYEVAVTPVISCSDPHVAGCDITLNVSPFVSGTRIDADGAYTLSVHATDRAGNVADRTVAFSIDAPPPAVASLNVDLPEGGFPTLSWPTLPQPDVVGYVVIRDGVRLTPSPITASTYGDSNFDPFSAHVYELFAVDSAGHEGARRTVTVQRVSASLAPSGTGGTLTRRFFDTVAITVGNPGSNPIPPPVAVEMTLREGASVLGVRTPASSAPVPSGGSITLNAVFSTGAGATATRDLDVAVTLPSEPATRVRRLQTFTLPVREPGRAVELFSDPIVLGGVARVRVKVLNQGSARLQVRTSQGGGPTPDVEVYVKDADGNVLGTSLLTDRGPAVINTAQFAFADIPVGGTYLSAPVEIPVPSSAAASVGLEAFIHETHSALLGATDFTGPELHGAASASTGVAPYAATATTDRSIYDQGQTVQISGHVHDTATGAAVPGVAVKIGISVRGFDRFFSVTSDSNGDYLTTFTPLPTEAGAYSVWATHPAVTERSSQATFAILGLALNPRAFNLRISQNSSFPITLALKNSGETPLAGFVFDVTSGDGVTGAVDQALLPSTLEPGQSASVTFTITAAANADLANFSRLRITTAEGAVRTFDVSLALLTALPTIQTTPNYTEVGLASGSSATRSVRIKNLGFAPLTGIRLDPPTTSWITLGVDPNLSDIPVGGEVDVPVVFTPPASVTPSIYSDRFVIRSSNHVPYTQNLYATVTSATTGDASFQVRNTENVLLPDASVLIQNVQVPSLTFTRTTDPNGVTTFEGLPSGPYQYRVQAPGVEPAGGTFNVGADQVTPVTVFMNVVYVTFEWTVTPIVIGDGYDFTLTATYDSNVPAPVLIADPQSFTMELEPGATFVGEYTLTNHGLVAADNITITPSAASNVHLETLVTEIPRLDAMQSIRIPFQLTRLSSSGTPPSPLVSTAAGIERAVAVVPASPQAAESEACSSVSYTIVLGSYTCPAGFITPTGARVAFTVTIRDCSGGCTSNDPPATCICRYAPWVCAPPPPSPPSPPGPGPGCVVCEYNPPTTIQIPAYCAPCQTAADCDDQNACTVVDSCDRLGGCHHVPVTQDLSHCQRTNCYPVDAEELDGCSRPDYLGGRFDVIDLGPLCGQVVLANKTLHSGLPCDEHDLCYRDCSKNTVDCNNEFCVRMAVACGARFPAGSPCGVACDIETSAICGVVEAAGWGFRDMWRWCTCAQ